ncbi:MAG: hypothetical protein GC189_09610 [Alphaproteobacteria bacterium]|nr:hypothetical protein [Alphaproteobacteria bacterium]
MGGSDPIDPKALDQSCGQYLLSEQGAQTSQGASSERRFARWRTIPQIAVANEFSFAFPITETAISAAGFGHLTDVGSLSTSTNVLIFAVYERYDELSANRSFQGNDEFLAVRLWKYFDEPRNFSHAEFQSQFSLVQKDSLEPIRRLIHFGNGGAVSRLAAADSVIGAMTLDDQGNIVAAECFVFITPDEMNTRAKYQECLMKVLGFYTYQPTPDETPTANATMPSMRALECIHNLYRDEG